MLWLNWFCIIGHLLETIEQQGMLLSIKEEELTTAEQKGEEKDVLIGRLKLNVSLHVTFLVLFMFVNRESSVND